MKATIEIETRSYNARRYGKPYCGIVDIDTKETRWGNWIGQPGDEGILQIECETGDILMQGQKDFRGSNGTPGFSVIDAAGERIPADSKAEAYRMSREIKAALLTAPAVNPLESVSTDDLLAELTRRRVAVPA